jgi:hypothetical protein
MTKRPIAKAAKTASCFMFVFVFLWREGSEASSGAVHGDTPPNHGIECVLLGQGPIQRFPLLLIQPCLPLFARFEPPRLSSLIVHDRKNALVRRKSRRQSQRVDLLCVVLGMVEEADKLRARAKHCRELAATAMDPAVEDSLLVMAEEFEEAAAELEVNRGDGEG